MANNKGPRTLTGFRAATSARDEIVLVREKMDEVLTDNNLDVNEKAKACMELLPIGANLFYFWPHNAAGDTITRTSVELNQVSAVVVRRGRPTAKNPNDYPGLVNVVSFVQNKRTGNIHIGESSWTKDPENAGLMWGAGRRFDLLNEDPKSNDFFKKEDQRNAGVMAAVCDMFRRLVDHTLVVVDDAGQADLPVLDIPVSKDGHMKLWGLSAAFKEQLAGVVYTKNWGIEGLHGMTAPAAGFAKTTSNGVEFHEPNKAVQLFHSDDVQGVLEGYIRQIFGADDYALTIRPKFPIGREFKVRQGESLWTPAGLPNEGMHSVDLNKDELLNKLEHSVSDAYEAASLYRGFCYWAALTQMKWYDDVAHLNGRYVSGKATPRVRLDETKLMSLAYGLEFSLTNAPSNYIAGRELLPDEKKKRRTNWQARELVLMELNNPALGSFYRSLSEQRSELSKQNITVPRHRRADHSFRSKGSLAAKLDVAPKIKHIEVAPDAEVKELPDELPVEAAKTTDTDLLQPAGSQSQPVMEAPVVPVEVVEHPVNVPTVSTFDAVDASPAPAEAPVEAQPAPVEALPAAAPSPEVQPEVSRKEVVSPELAAV